jgi:group I intron endonuclease
MKISGIYKIINKTNGKYYVGSSNNIKKRFYDHKRRLNKNVHNNLKLQNAWNKYSSWIFSIIEIIEPNDLLIIEQKYLDKAKLEPDETYNVCFNALAPMTGRNHSIYTKIKMKESQSKINRKNFRHNVRTKRYQSKIMKGRYNGSKNPNFGKKHSVETRMKMGTPDQTIFNFKNLFTSETFTGIRSDFAKKYNFDKANLYNLIHKRSNNCKGWVII